MRRSLLTICLCAVPAALPAQSNIAQAAGSITEDAVKHHIGVLAADSMRGRNTPSPELDEVARYIASNFEKSGLKPGGDDGTFLQHYTIRRTRLDPTRSTITGPDGLTLHLGDDFISIFGASRADTGGDLVILSGAAASPQALAGFDVKGKVVAVPGAFTPNGNVARSTQMLLGGIFRSGPAAILIISNRDDASWKQSVDRQLSRVRMSVTFSQGGRMPIVEVRDQGIGKLFQAHGIDISTLRNSSELKLEPVSGVRLNVKLSQSVVGEATAPNVVGILEGSDPALKNEYVVYSAHMDHVGVGRPDASGDSIYNGADDDASGTTGVIELAAAFAKLDKPPRRSIIFLTVSGEEKGLWGSDYFTSHPPVPIKNIVADLNADMIGRNWPDTIVVIGEEHSDLGETLKRVNAAHPELNMNAIPDRWPRERFYFRSDHYNFARRGVPILFFFNGTHPDYHRPSDDPSKINAEKEARIIRLLFYLGLDVANADERPKWNPESYSQIVQTDSD